MNRSDILVPLNLEKHGFEGLEFAARMSGEMPVQTTLLYVVELNIFPTDNRVYNELCLEYHERLRVLGQSFFENQPRLSVRVGKPHEEILAEARESNPELIVMAAAKAERRKWPFLASTVDRVVQSAPCLTVVLTDSWKAGPNGFDRLLREFPMKTAAQQMLCPSAI